MQTLVPRLLPERGLAIAPGRVVSELSPAAERMSLREGLESVGAAVYRVLRRMGVGDGEIDDAKQRVFIQLARRWDSLDRLPADERHAWACTVAGGVAVDVARERGRRQRLLRLDESTDREPGDEGPDVEVERKRKLEVLDAILRRMPEARRVVFVLYEIEELEMRQIAERLGLPIGTVASRLRKAREEFERAALGARAAAARNGGRP